MRLWHQSLIHYLPRQQLLGQHRECAALRGLGWGKEHSVVDYVFKYDLAHLYQYHLIVMDEMNLRGYNPDHKWYVCSYRGKQLLAGNISDVGIQRRYDEIIYPEHNDKYLKECLLNLQSKNVQLINGETIEHMLIMLNLKSGI